MSSLKIDDAVGLGEVLEFLGDRLESDRATPSAHPWPGSSAARTTAPTPSAAISPGSSSSLA